MSRLKVKQIKTKLLQMFEEHLDLSDIGTHDPHREEKVLSRCLAAFAVFYKTSCTEQEAGTAVWDRGDDNGIDAAYFDSGDRSVFLVQSKWIKQGSGEPPAAEIEVFCSGVRDLIENEVSNFSSSLQAKVEAISEHLQTPGVSVEMVVATTGSSVLAQHATANLNRLLRALNGDDSEPMASSSVMGLSEVYESLASDLTRKKVELDATLLDWSKITDPHPAYFGVIDGLQIKQWWNRYKKSLVARNIRHSLGVTDVNSQIRATAIERPEDFWYFNNGITLVAEKAEKAPAGASSRKAGTFTFEGASVVNGAQTASTLARVESDEQLARVRVPIRVILLDSAPPNFGQEVTRTNNLQNRIESRDFVAQDEEQHRLKSEMAMENINYQFSRSDDLELSEASCELIEVTTALASALNDPSLSVQIKAGIGRVFADLSKAPYKKIFNPQVSGARAFNATVVLRKIDSWIEDRKKKLDKKSGKEWGVLVHGNRILAASVFTRLPPNVLDQPIHDFASAVEQLDLGSLCTTSWNKMVEVIKEDYQNNFLAVLFKSPSKSKDVYQKSLQK